MGETLQSLLPEQVMEFAGTHHVLYAAFAMSCWQILSISIKMERFIAVDIMLNA